MIAYQRTRQYSQLNNRLTMVIQSAHPKNELKIHIVNITKTIQCQFDCKLKCTVKGVIWNYKKGIKTT